MGKSKRRTKHDVRFMSLSDRQSYVTQMLKRAKAIADGVPDGDKLYAAFEPMLRFVVLSEAPYLGGCHDTSAVLCMQLRQIGLQEADVALCIGEVGAYGLRFDHSWLEVRGQVFDVAICAPKESGGFAGGPVFAGMDLTTNKPAQAKFGVESEDTLDDDAAYVHDMSLSQYLDFQKSRGSKPMTNLVYEVYGVDDAYVQELLTKYGSVNREWRNPLLNPPEHDQNALRQKISFAHLTFPADCASPNLICADGIEEFPGFSGTGFFARRGNEVFYVTARHCLTKNPDADIASLVKGLHVPYTLTALTVTTDDYVQFGEVISLKHNSDDIPGKFVDVLVMTIRRPADTNLYKTLLARAVKLPPDGQWLDNFVQHPTAKPDFDKGKGIRFTVIGYPNEGTASSIKYPEGQPVEIAIQPAKFDGYLGKGTGIDRYMLNDVSWEVDLNGFSGSPVIVGFKNEYGHNYALAGMLVSGGSKKAQFIRISLLTKALKT